ncbi:MAG: site-specific integrase, partial [Moraxellaceae bacterium]|nr:site-specific integrase [Moraxellaceae bacterium]
QPFPLTALNTIFSSPVYSANARPLGGAGEASYWLPLLGLYTGARLEELGQLHPNDVYEESTPDESMTAWVIRITDGEGQSLKNVSSRRRIPVHPALINLGFIEYAVRAKSEKRYRLFDKLKLNKYGKHTDAWSKWFSRYLRHTCGITDTSLVFHSFRHTFKDYCRAASIPEDVHDSFTGHTSDSVARSYGGEYPLAPLVSAINKFKISGLITTPKALV